MKVFQMEAKLRYRIPIAPKTKAAPAAANTLISAITDPTETIHACMYNLRRKNCVTTSLRAAQPRSLGWSPLP